MLDWYNGEIPENPEQAAVEKGLEESEAAVLETGLERLTPEQQQILQNFDERIETEFRKLDTIEHMEEISKSWRDGMTHSFQVEKIRSLVSEIGDCALKHADDAVFSELLVGKADQVNHILSERLENRAQVLLKKLDHFEDDVIRSLH